MLSPFPALNSQQNLLLLSSAGATIEQDLLNATAVNLTNHSKQVDRSGHLRNCRDMYGLKQTKIFFTAIKLSLFVSPIRYS